MTLRIQLSGDITEDAFYEQLNGFGWTQLDENNQRYLVLYRSITINGRITEVDRYKWKLSRTKDSLFLDSLPIPDGINKRTGYIVYRVLAGKIVSDLIRNDCLMISSYSISFR